MENAENVAKSIVDQWDSYGRASTPKEEIELYVDYGGEPKDVFVARALLEKISHISELNRSYGCEVMDPYGTIWNYSREMVEAIKDVLENESDRKAVSEFGGYCLDDDIRNKLKRLVGFK